MQWSHLTDEDQLNNIINRSQEKSQVIFKHSSRCSISSIVLNRLKQNIPPEDVDFYFLDLLAYRKISNKVTQLFHVHHESPQILIIKKGKCVYDESHLGISMDEIIEHAYTNTIKS